MLATLSGTAARDDDQGARRSPAPHHRRRGARARDGRRGARSRRAARYGERTVPMDDALVQCALDLGGRPFYRCRCRARFYDHWMRSFCDNARATLHLRVLRGEDRHHVVEAAFKALGFALRRRSPKGTRVQHEGRRCDWRSRRDPHAARGRLPRRSRRARREGRAVRRPRDIGDPVELAERYERDGADEIVFLDIGATPRSARRCSISRARRRSGCSFR